jgi:hypothetical protein
VLGCRPRLRSDLAFAPVRDGRRRAIQVFDPVRRRRLLLSEFTYAVAWMLDGSDLARIERRIQRDLHTRVSRDALRVFVGQLVELGLLELEPEVEVHDTLCDSGRPTPQFDPRQLQALLTDAR